MGLNPNAVSANMRGIPVTKPEVFVLLVKLIGVLMLVVVEVVIVVSAHLPP